MKGSFLVSFLAVFVLAITSISAIEINESAGDFQVSIKGIDVCNEDGCVANAIINAFAGESIPLRVLFKAGSNAEDVRVRAWISGHRADIVDSTNRFDVLKDSWYSNSLALKLPGDIDPVEDFVLVVRIEDRKSSFEKEFSLRVQRELFEVELLSVEAESQVVAGNTLNLDIVVKNRGSEELEDLFVIVKVPILNIEKKVFFSDLGATDDGEIILSDNRIIIRDSNDDEDSAQRMVSLRIPEDAKPGVYSVEVTALNADISEKVTRSFVILESEERSDVLVAVPSKDANVGQEIVFDLIIVNQGPRNRVYEIMPEVSGSLTVSIDEPIVSVPGDSSKGVKVRVAPGKEGTYTFGVVVNSDGSLVERASLSIEAKGQQALENSVVVLTVILAIIFVVLLVVLIVLLTRKPGKEIEESYY